MPDAGCWMPDAGCRMLDAGCRMPDAGCRMLDAGCWMLDGGCWMPDAGCRMPMERSDIDSRRLPEGLGGDAESNAGLCLYVEGRGYPWSAALLCRFGFINL